MNCSSNKKIIELKVVGRFDSLVIDNQSRNIIKMHCIRFSLAGLVIISFTQLTSSVVVKIFKINFLNITTVTVAVIKIDKNYNFEF